MGSTKKFTYYTIKVQKDFKQRLHDIIFQKIMVK